MLNRVQLRHCVPKARRQPKHLCSPCRSTATAVALQAFEFSQCWPQRGILWSLALDETHTPWAGAWKPRDAGSAEMLRLQLLGTVQRDTLGL